MCIDLDAAHEIMLARVDRDAVFRHIIALLEQVVIDHREAVLDLLGILVRNVEVEFIGSGAAAFEHDRIGNDVAGCQLQTVVIALHEALTVAVEQIRALSADSLGDEETLAGMAVVEGCGVELDIAEVLYFCAHIVSH